MNFPSSQPSPRYPLAWGERTYIMGILNVTPDSFSGDGLLAREGEDARNLVSLAMELGRKYVSVGADILDVGGESTRPGSQPTSLNEEIGRVIPVIQALAAELDVIISVDTYKAVSHITTKSSA